MKKSETIELKKSTAELKDAVISISAILNKHGRGKLYFGVKDDGIKLNRIIDPKHPLVKLTQQMDWSAIDHQLEKKFSDEGRPGIGTRLNVLVHCQMSF